MHEEEEEVLLTSRLVSPLPTGRQDVLEVLGPGREADSEEIFNILDRDGNGDVSIDEMTMLIVGCGRERKDRASSIQDISSAIAVLDRIMTIIVIIGEASPCLCT